MYAINLKGDISQGDRVLVASELHLQQSFKAPAHEGGVGKP